MASTSAAPLPVAVAAPPPEAAPPATVNDTFLKPSSPRKRRRSPEGTEPSPRSLEGQVRDKLTVSPVSPIALTGANEMAELKRRKLDHAAENTQPGLGKLITPNPRQQALGALRGVSSKNMSKATDAPTLATANHTDGNPSTSAQTSPTSNASFNTATSATAGGPQVASPTEIGHPDNDGNASGDNGPNHQPSSPKAYTYPDPRLSAAPMNNNYNRNNSVGGGEENRSPAGSNKKHKCPYCETEFTRHHNLKSHLLTHSQEKPYICKDCDMRFRRLHDLKRHGKLHTGERPHVCNICNRKFARGDALARHTKGAAGCAGHRSSVGGSYPDGGEGVMEMDGLMYSNHESQEPGEMDETDAANRARHAQYSGSGSLQPPRGLPHTYPPAQRTGPYLQAPQPPHSGNVSPSSQHTPYTHGSQPGSYPPPFPHGSMTESPGPISPSAGPNDPRRSSINSQLHSYARQGTSHAHGSPQAPTATMGLPPPSSVAGNSTSSTQFTQLPSLPSITTSDPRGPAQHGHAHNPSGSYASAPGSASTHNSLSSHGQGSGERSNLGIDEKDRLYAIIHEMRRNMEAMNEKLSTLMNEVESLKRPRPAGT